MGLEPDERPSIFARPEPEEEPTATQLPPEPVSYVAPSPLRPDRMRNSPAHGRAVIAPSRRLIVAIGGSGLLMLLVGGFVAGSLLRPEADGVIAGATPSASATVSPSPTSTPSDKPTPSPTPAATPAPTRTATATPTPAVAASATPAPVPVGPAQQLAVGGWATVTVGALNVRAAPDAESASSYSLVEGAVASVLEGPVGADGLDWYRITSIGGARGWAASGPASNPYLSTIAESDDLVRCGTVERDVLAVVNGRVETRDPIHIGELALPRAAFDDEELGALELMRATGGEACFSASTRADESVVVYAQFNYYACGRARETGDLIELRPSTGMDVVVEYQVKDVVVIHPAILDRSGSSQMSANIRGVLRWMARSGGWGCLSHGINEGPDGTVGGVQLDARGCGVVESAAGGNVVLRAASGGDAITLVEASVDPALPIGSPASIIAWYFDFPDGRSASVAPYEFGGGC